MWYVVSTFALRQETSYISFFSVKLFSRLGFYFVLNLFYLLFLLCVFLYFLCLHAGDDFCLFCLI